jgi:hypothetical protein
MTVRNVVQGLQQFMIRDEDGIGAVRASREQRCLLAATSKLVKCPICMQAFDVPAHTRNGRQSAKAKSAQLQAIRPQGSLLLRSQLGRLLLLLVCARLCWSVLGSFLVRIAS